MSGMIPQCAPKRTSVDSSELMGPIPQVSIPQNPPAASRQADLLRPCHCDAVLVSMLTTSTRRLTGSIGALGSFGLLLP
jgi:hypothetical protein